MKIKIEISIIKPALGTEKYDTTEAFETSFEGNRKEYLDLVSKIIPLISEEV